MVGLVSTPQNNGVKKCGAVRLRVGSRRHLVFSSYVPEFHSFLPSWSYLYTLVPQIQYSFLAQWAAVMMKASKHFATRTIFYHDGM